MKKPLIIFVTSALIGLGLGYLVFDVIAPGQSQPEVAVNDKEDSKSSEEATEETDKTVAVSDDNILQAKGCLGCHAVSGLNLEGGATGPDLTQAFNNVEGKHGKPLAEFLKEPTSAVMSSVIGGNPLTDEEISQVVEALKKAAE
ncbi:cytochrome C [Cytobacillus solani]|uniref:Cytochrome C n=1 Tax=Cytobacillus solani TaxID=1637975 RepID=A0A0Q3TEN8_9BACI|nr:cytochrome c [Cytobacillus solani]KOP71744.1 cytochrome C [Bacillus sp. FJAT-21945]KQL21581.1 cytochrome C [Cytobacillus solani]USK54890.1 cytochrome C [Cytobacillus solani]